MASTIAMLRHTVVQASNKHTASLIVLHGSGDSGHGFREWFSHLLIDEDEDFIFPHMRVIYPSAPVRPYSANGGFPMAVWFDRKQISPFCAEDYESVTSMCDSVRHLVDAEVNKGVPRNRIIVGGFSMGGALALHYAFRFERGLAGVFALSSFLGQDSAVYKSFEDDPLDCPPLFQAHGVSDTLVRFKWGKETHDQLVASGVHGQFHAYDKMTHDMTADEIIALKHWLVERVPVNVRRGEDAIPSSN